MHQLALAPIPNRLAFSSSTWKKSDGCANCDVSRTVEHKGWVLIGSRRLYAASIGITTDAFEWPWIAVSRIAHYLCGSCMSVLYNACFISTFFHTAARMVLNQPATVRPYMSPHRCLSYTGFQSLKGLTSNYVCLSTRHLLGKHYSTLRTLSGHWLICHREPRRGQHPVAICFCHEQVESSETERLPSRPHASGIVSPLTSNSTSRRQHLSINAVLNLFCLIGASLNICKWLCTALPVF